MLLENNLKKFKNIPEVFRNVMELFSLTVVIFFIFFILNIFYGPSDKIVDVNKTLETEQTIIVDQTVISSLPRGKLIFYESDDGHKLSLKEYEVVCKNTKIVTQRAVMGANITNSEAHKLYTANGSRIDKYLVKCIIADLFIA